MGVLHDVVVHLALGIQKVQEHEGAVHTAHMVLGGRSGVLLLVQHDQQLQHGVGHREVLVVLEVVHHPYEREVHPWDHLVDLCNLQEVLWVDTDPDMVEHYKDQALGMGVGCAGQMEQMEEEGWMRLESLVVRAKTQLEKELQAG